MAWADVHRAVPPHLTVARFIAALAAAVLVPLSACGNDDTTVMTERAQSGPVGACPSPPGAPGQCEPFDPEDAARTNEEHRRRIGLSEQHARLAEGERVRIEALLRTTSGRALTADDVIELLRAAGYSAVSAYGRSDSGGGVAFGVDSGVGCIVGSVRGAEVTAEAVGATADAACLSPQGH